MDDRRARVVWRFTEVARRRSVATGGLALARCFVPLRRRVARLALRRPDDGGDRLAVVCPADAPGREECPVGQPYPRLVVGSVAPAARLKRETTSWPGLPFPLFALAIVALTILFTWTYNGTEGSLLIVLLFHAAINFTLTLVPVQPTSTMPLRTCLIGVGLLWAAAIVVVIAEGPARLTRKPPT